jgi:hypothetical protein
MVLFLLAILIFGVASGYPAMLGQMFQRTADIQTKLPTGTPIMLRRISIPRRQSV